MRHHCTMSRAAVWSAKAVGTSLMGAAARRAEQRQPFGRRAHPNTSPNCGISLRRHAAGIGRVARLGRQVGPRGQGAEALPLGVAADAHGDWPVGGREGLIGDDVGVGVAVALGRGPGEGVVGDVGQPADLGVEESHIDVLAVPGAFAVVQRGQDGRGGVERGADVAMATPTQAVPLGRAGDIMRRPLGLIMKS
jgi:hypothetical protein